MNKFVSLAFVIFITLALIVVIGCSSGGSANPVELVPQNANMVGEVNLARILTDDDFADIYDRLPKKAGDPRTLDEALDAFETETGIDLRQFEEGLFFGDISRSGEDGGYFGTIIKGNFNRNDLISALEDNMGEQFETISYKGYQIFADANEQFALCFLSDEMLVIGGMAPVKDTIQVRGGAREALGGEILGIYNSLGDALIKVASIAPPAETGERLWGGWGESQINLSAFSEIEQAGIALTKRGDEISLSADLYFSNSESAQDAEKLLSFVTLLVDMLPVPEQGKSLLPDLLDKLQVERQDKLLSITLELTVWELEDAIESSKSP